MSTPTKEQIAAVRERGFRNSMTHHPADKVDRLTKRYMMQAARRDERISEFRNVLTKKK